MYDGPNWGPIFYLLLIDLDNVGFECAYLVIDAMISWNNLRK